MKGDVSRAQAAATAAAEQQLAVFRVAGAEYAIDIMRITEIIRPQKVTKVPRSPKVVEGIINLRGKVIPVVDMRRRFGLGHEEGEARKARVIIVSIAGRLVGVSVDEVEDVIYLGPDQIEEAPDTVRGAGSEYISGVGKHGDSLIIILDTAKLLTAEEIRGLDAAGGLGALSEEPGGEP